jgi:glycine betaine transporter
MFKNPILLLSLLLTGGVAAWGIADTAGLASFSSTVVGTMFKSRGWFIMLTACLLLFLCIWLAFSKYGRMTTSLSFPP